MAGVGRPCKVRWTESEPTWTCGLLPFYSTVAGSGCVHSLAAAGGRDLVTTFNFADRAPQILRTGTAVQQRLVLEAVGLNYILKARRVAYSLDKPFDGIAEAGGLSNWSGLVDDVRTWALNTTEYFKIPDLRQVDVTWPSPQPRPWTTASQRGLCEDG